MNLTHEEFHALMRVVEATAVHATVMLIDEYVYRGSDLPREKISEASYAARNAQFQATDVAYRTLVAPPPPVADLRNLTSDQMREYANAVQQAVGEERARRRREQDNPIGG
jgi:hypothetical protein